MPPPVRVLTSGEQPVIAGSLLVPVSVIHFTLGTAYRLQINQIRA